MTDVYTEIEVDSKIAGFKNYIINGKKVINQRNSTSTDNSYNQDRWYKAGNNWFQGIEGDGNLISGKKYTLSWVGSATASYYVGTATSTTINSQTFTAIANGGSFTLTISAGQNLWIKFASDATGSTFNFVQLEEGSVATPFEHRPIGLELSLCQRYYEKSCNIDVVPVTAASTGQFTSTAAGANNRLYSTSITFKVTKRAAPTMSAWTYTGTSGSWHYGLFGSTEGVAPAIFATTSMTGTQAYMLAAPSGQNAMYGHWAASAEL